MADRQLEAILRIEATEIKNGNKSCPKKVRKRRLLTEWEAATAGKPLVLLLCFSSFLRVSTDHKKCRWQLQMSVSLRIPA